MNNGTDGIGFFIAFFVGIFFLWIIGGGPDEDRSRVADSQDTRRTSIFAGNRSSDPASPSDVRRELRDVSREVEDLREDVREAQIWGVHSPYEGQVRLSRGDVRTTFAKHEYVRLRASGGNDTSINISGWRLESYVTGNSATIPYGTRLFRNDRVNTKTPIFLNAGESAIVVTGPSPVGTSFHENSCIGYLREFQDFSPSLPRSCPRPSDELEERYPGFPTNSCVDFTRRVPRCETVEDFIDDTLPEDRPDRACQNFLENTLTYSSCVDGHQFEFDFYDGDWRVYLDTSNMWRADREIIKLVDAQGRTVDVIEY